MHFPRIFAAAGVILATTQIGAQTRPPTTTGPTTGSNTPTNLGGTGTVNSNANTPARYPGDAVHPVLLTGKVAVSDGSGLPGPVLIERVCAGGKPRPEAYTDAKGHFSVTLGQETAILPDASEAPDRNRVSSVNPSGGVRDNQLLTCELRATMPGYRSDTVSLANHRYMDNPDIGTIVLHRLANVEGLTTSATSALAPKDARKAFEKAQEAAKKNKPDEEQAALEKAVELYPKYASAWYELGRLDEQRDHVDKAREAYNQAIAADSKYINPYERLYLIAYREQKWQETADLTDRVLHLNPYDFPGAYFYNAAANTQLGKLEPAEKSAREALKQDTSNQHPEVNHVLGVILAQKQDLAGAAECFRAFLKAVPQGAQADAVRTQLAQIEQMLQAQAKPQDKEKDKQDKDKQDK